MNMSQTWEENLDSSVNVKSKEVTMNTFSRNNNSAPLWTKGYDEEEEYEEYDEREEYDSGYEWTDEDAWDAMTDGMYGDYPGSDWDPEMFGY